MTLLSGVVEQAERPLDYGPAAAAPIFQHVWEFSELLRLYRECAPRRVLEIGTYHGGTLYHWLQQARPPVTVVSVDSYAVGVDNRALYPAWTPDGVTLHALCADSHAAETVAMVAAFGPFDWCFIDAGHYYPEVRADWDLYRPLVRPGGIVAFHDILTSPQHPEIEVERLWREIQRAGYVTQELVADPAAIWGGIGVVAIP